MKFSYPEKKEFIFSIFDDTDVSTLEYIKPIYEYLSELNIKSTKSVWPLCSHIPSDYSGSHTLEDEDYAYYVKELQERGFEIGFHGTTMTSSTREKIEKGFKVFHSVLGRYPRIYTAHSTNRENLYWGVSRFSFPLVRTIYSKKFGRQDDYYQGIKENSPFFWGDFSLKYIDYVRNLTFNEINLLNISLKLPYTDNKKPWVKYWFYTSDADNVEDFNRLINEKNQDELHRQNGVCIISTHFGKGYIQNGQLCNKTKLLLKRISEKNGWFVPVSTVLDFLKSINENNPIKDGELKKIEYRWLLDYLKRRWLKSKNYEKTEIPYLLKAGNI